LVVAFAHSGVYQCNQFFVHGKIRKALAEVNGIVLNSQGTHYGEDGSANVWQFAFYLNCRHNNKIY